MLKHTIRTEENECDCTKTEERPWATLGAIISCRTCFSKVLNVSTQELETNLPNWKWVR